MYYAQITNDVVTSVTQTAGPIDSPNVVEIDGLLDIAGYTYNPETGEFTPPAPVVPDRWAAIKAIRDHKTQNGGYKVGDDWFHSDTFSRTQQMGLVMMGENIPVGLRWKTMDGVFVPMTRTLAQQIFTAAATQDSRLFAHAEALKADPTADIEAGWPETFQGA